MPRRLTDDILDDIEAAAQGKARGLPVFAHPADTLLLVADVRRLRAAEGHAIRLATILRKMEEKEEESCRLDHHGFCQSHGCGAPCLVAEAREALRTMGR